MCTQEANKPKTNPALQLTVYIFEKRRDQSISKINIRLHPFSCTRFPTNEICAWLPCYRFQRGPNLPLEIRRLSLASSFSSSSPVWKYTQRCTQLIVCTAVMPLGIILNTAVVGKSCRANSLVLYLKLLDMINICWYWL